MPAAPTRPAARARRRAIDTAERAQRRFPWLTYVSEALERERLAAAGLLAGGLAFRLFLWLVPVGLVLAAVFSFWVEADQVGLEDAARRFGLGGVAAASAVAAIRNDAHSRWYFLAVGLVLLPWFGAGVVRALRVTHAVAWRLPPDRLGRPFAAGLVFSALAVPLILGSALVSPLREHAPGPGLGVTLALGLLYGGVFVWVEKLLPSRADRWTAFVPGAVLFVLGTQAMHVLVVYYLGPKLGRSSQLYGTLGAATVVLFWLYLVARLIVAGAFLNAAIWARHHAD